MNQLPGTTLEIKNIGTIEILDSLFSAGGLVLSQVCTITGLESYMVQNWVRRKFITPPKNKKYTKDQLCRIITINMLKDAMSIDLICSLISYVNGELDDESDDIISDSQLYIYFAQVYKMSENKPENLQENLDIVLESYKEKLIGEKNKVRNTLEIMLTAFFSVQFQKKALLLFKTYDI